MWIGLGGSAPQQVLWRRLGDDPFARMHLDTATESIAVDSRAETRLLLGIRFWLAARLGSEERVWSVSAAEANELTGGVGQVLAAYRGYLEATSPRIRDAGTFMDRASGGSKFFGIADPQSRVRTFRFDWQAQTKTPGRLFEDDVLIELGSALEKEALDLLSRAAMLRRGFQGDRAGDDAKLKMLDEQLDGYRKSFVQKR